MCEHFGACEVVDCNNFITFCAEHLSERETSDTTKTVDSDFYVCHYKFLHKGVFRIRLKTIYVSNRPYFTIIIENMQV